MSSANSLQLNLSGQFPEAGAESRVSLEVVGARGISGLAQPLGNGCLGATNLLIAVQEEPAIPPGESPAFPAFADPAPALRRAALL